MKKNRGSIKRSHEHVVAHLMGIAWFVAGLLAGYFIGVR